MPNRQRVVPVFVFFLFISFFLYALSFTSFGRTLIGLVELSVSPLRSSVFSVYAASKDSKSELERLKDENAELTAKLAEFQAQQKDMQALRDQFQTSDPVSTMLLPTRIVGLKAFLPGISLPEQVVIDKGSKDGVKTNDAIVYKNNLVGKVRIANEHLSLVDLASGKGFSVTATTTGTNALGISKGQGQSAILLDNVVLSDSLHESDLVVTKGSTDSDESGIPPNLVIGKIISVDKKASNLFQTAKVQPLIDITRISTLFIVLR